MSEKAALRLALAALLLILGAAGLGAVLVQLHSLPLELAGGCAGLLGGLALLAVPSRQPPPEPLPPPALPPPDPQVTEALVRSSGAQERLAVHAAEFTTTVGDLGQHLDGLAGTVREALSAMEQAADRLEERDREWAAQLDRLAERLAALGQDRAEADRQRMGQLVQVVERLAAQERSGEERLVALIARMEEALARVAEGAQQALGQVAAAARGTTAEMNQALGETCAAVGGLTVEVTALAQGGARALREASTQTVQNLGGVAKYLEGIVTQTRELYGGSKATVEELRHVKTALDGVVSRLGDYERSTRKAAEHLLSLDEGLDTLNDSLPEQARSLSRLLVLSKQDHTKLQTSLDRLNRAVEALVASTSRR